MLFSSSYLLPVFAVVTSVIAVNPHDRQLSPPGSSGAAYLISNDPSGNQVLSMSIASDGTVSRLTATSTGGLGGYCNCPAGPDPLNSQGSIVANAASQILVAVNPGSNSVSMFKIDPADPAKLLMVGKPVSSGGEFPVSVAINVEGTMACALNSGAVNGVQCFRPSQFGLVAIPNTLRSLGLDLTTPPPAFGSASQVAFSEDGQTLIAAVKGNIPATPGFLAAWAIMPDGSLSASAVTSSAPKGSLFPYSITLIPETNAVLVSDAGVGFDIFNFGEEGSLSATSTSVAIPGQNATCWSAYSSKSGNYYLTDGGVNKINEVSVSKDLTGSLVKQYQQPSGSAVMDIDIATIDDNDFLYVLSANATIINVFNVNIAGQAASVQNFDLSAAAKAIGITLNPNLLQGMTTFAADY